MGNAGTLSDRCIPAVRASISLRHLAVALGNLPLSEFPAKMFIAKSRPALRSHEGGATARAGEKVQNPRFISCLKALDRRDARPSAGWNGDGAE
jgi:hypothetical protein